MTIADDKQKREDSIKKAELVGAGAVGLAAGVVLAGAAAMAIDPDLQGKVADIKSGMEDKRDEVVEKIEKVKKAASK